MDTPLAVSVADGITLVHHGEILVAEGRVVAWDLELPTPPTMDEAAEASTRYAGFDRHEFFQREPDLLNAFVQSTDRFHLRLINFAKPLVAAVGLISMEATLN